MEVSQFTYFQQVGGLDVRPVSGELTYGLERLAMYVFGLDRVYDLPFNDPQSQYPLTYGDVFLENEKQQSAYNFEHADTEVLQRWFSDCEKGLQETPRPRQAAAASRLRAGAESQPHLQPAGCPRRDLAHRTPELHRPRA
jgi:glycyl-tRNA synthetase alpha chain